MGTVVLSFIKLSQIMIGCGCLFKDNRFKGITRDDLRKDLIAVVTVGVVAIPLGMAFAIASGVSPEYGIYTTIIAGLIVALIGGSHFQIAGPTGAFIPILLAIVLQYGYEDLLIAGMLAGIMRSEERRVGEGVRSEGMW